MAATMNFSVNQLDVTKIGRPLDMSSWTRSFILFLSFFYLSDVAFLDPYFSLLSLLSSSLAYFFLYIIIFCWNQIMSCHRQETKVKNHLVIVIKFMNFIYIILFC